MWNGMRDIIKLFHGNEWRFAALVALLVAVVILARYKVISSIKEKFVSKAAKTNSGKEEAVAVHSQPKAEMGAVAETPISQPVAVQPEPTPKESVPPVGGTSFNVNVSGNGKIDKVVQGNQVNEK